MRIEIDTRNRIIRVVRDARVNNDAAFESKHPRDKTGKFASVRSGGIASETDFKGIATSQSKEIHNSLSENIRKYPFMDGHLSFVGSHDSNKLVQICTDANKLDDATQACYKILPNGNGVIYFNPDTIKNKSFTDFGRYHPIGCDTLKSVVDHEFGHALWYKLGLNNYKNGFKPIQKYIMQYFGHHADDDIANNLSSYASTNAAEFFAEAFAELQNNPNPRPVARKIGELLDKEIKAQKLDERNERK